MSIAEELITRGWYQGDYQGQDGSVCIAGAVECALLGEVKSARNVLWDEERDKVTAACAVLVPLIGCEFPGQIGIWNDAPERTFDDVLRVAKEADEILGGAQ